MQLRRVTEDTRFYIEQVFVYFGMFKSFRNHLFHYKLDKLDGGILSPS